MRAPVAFQPLRAVTTAPGVRGKRLHSLAPRMAPSAIRVPDPVHVPLALPFAPGRPQVFVHEGARQALERRFAHAYPGPVSLHINDNTSSMVTFSRAQGQLRVRVHHMFLDAPPYVQDALVRYVLGSDREASAITSAFIAENHHRIRASRPPLHPLRTKGDVHDLLAILRRVNDRYFGGTHDALITWGRSGGQKPAHAAGARSARRSIKLGSYSAIERLIRVHPVLDRPWVPRYFVEYIVYHELLHHVMPQSRAGGRTMLHPPEFQAKEREFHAFDRAIQWEKEHLARLLRG